MLEEKGVVKEVRGDKALVLMERREACAQCQAMGACRGIEAGKEMEARAVNNLGAGVGDRVRVSMPDGALLKSSLILYLIPALGLVIGAFLGYYMGGSYGWNTDLSAMFCALLALGLSFLIVSSLNERWRQGQTHWPQIREIISRADHESPDYGSIFDPQDRTS